MPHLARSRRASGGTPGWDPCEVWRTRILLPRLAAKDGERLSDVAAVATSLVVESASHVHDESAIGSDANLSGHTSANDEALKRELLDVLGWLLLAGFTTTYLVQAEEQRPRRS